MKKLLIVMMLICFVFQFSASASGLLSRLTAPASEIPEPDFYFNAGAEKYEDDEYTTYIYEFTDDPFGAVAAYVELLTDTYSFEITDTYTEDGLGAWHLSDGAAAVRVYYDMSGSGFEVYIDVDNALNCIYAETWDWNAAPDAGQGDISVLPDFLAIDNSGKYQYAYAEGGGARTSLVFESRDEYGCYEQAENYVNALVAMGYQIVETENKDYNDWDMDKWYLHSGLSGLDNIETGIEAHVFVRINSYHDKDKNSLSVHFVEGITMKGYDDEPAPDYNGGDGGDEDCFYCKDGACKKCDGTGQVLKNVPGTAEWISQNCTRCSFGQCLRCGGDGKN